MSLPKINLNKLITNQSKESKAIKNNISKKVNSFIENSYMILNSDKNSIDLSMTVDEKCLKKVKSLKDTKVKIRLKKSNENKIELINNIVNKLTSNKDDLYKYHSKKNRTNIIKSHNPIEGRSKISYSSEDFSLFNNLMINLKIKEGSFENKLKVLENYNFNKKVLENKPKEYEINPKICHFQLHRQGNFMSNIIKNNLNSLYKMNFNSEFNY